MTTPGPRPGGHGIQPSRDLFRGVLFLLLVLTISRIHQHIGLEAVRPALVLAGFAALYAFLNPRTLAFGTLRTGPAWAVAAMGALAVVTVPFSISIGASALYLIGNFSKVLLFTLLLLLAIRRSDDLLLFVVGYVVAAALLVWMSIFVFDLSPEGAGQMARLGDMYSYDSNDTGLVLVVGIPLALLMFESVGRVGKALAVAVLIGTGWTIALTGSRGAFLSLAVVAGALLLTHRALRITQRAAILVGLAGALVLAAPEGYWRQMGTVLTLQEDYNWEADVGRLALAQRGIDYMMSHPVTGLGLANFPRAEGTISDMAHRTMPGVGIPWTAPHNSYIQAASELGIPGAVAFLALVFGGMAAMIRLRLAIPRQWARGDPEQRFLRAASYYLFLSYLGFAVAAMFLSFAYLDPIYVLSAFAAGLILSVRRRMAMEAGGEEEAPAVGPEQRSVPVPAREPAQPGSMVPGMRGGLARHRVGDLDPRASA